MARMTLLEMTKNILSALDEDDVENIDDTPSSAQVVETIKEIYYQIVQNDNVPELKKLHQLDVGTAPVGLQIPSDISKIEWIKYDKKRASDTRTFYSEVIYKEPLEFLNICNSLNSDSVDVEQFTEPSNNTVSFSILNNKPPQYWTSFNDLDIIFDSYDLAVDALGVDTAKTQVYGQRVPEWTANNDFTPALDENRYAYFLLEAKATCFANLKQQPNVKIEQQVRQQKSKQQNDLYRYNQDNYRLRQPGFGRR